MKIVKLYIITLFFWLLSASLTNLSAYGFGYQKGHDGTKPNLGIYHDMIIKNGGAYLGDEQNKKLYLTFDCGYEKGYTLALIDILNQNDVKGCFFITGHYLKTNKDIVAKMIADGHMVANHTMHHYDMAEVGRVKALEDIKQLDSLFYQNFNFYMPPLYRPPKGSFTPEGLKYISQKGYVPLFWSIAYRDWNQDLAEKEVIDKIINELHPGAVILLHAVSETNMKVLDQLIKKAIDLGYQFGDTSEFIMP